MSYSPAFSSVSTQVVLTVWTYGRRLYAQPQHGQPVGPVQIGFDGIGIGFHWDPVPIEDQRKSHRRHERVCPGGTRGRGWIVDLVLHQIRNPDR